MEAGFPPWHVGNDLARLWYYTTEDYKMKCAHGAEFFSGNEVRHLFEKLAIYYGTHRFITVCVRTHRLSVFWVRWIQCMIPILVLLRSILILSPTYVYIFEGAAFLSGFLVDTACTSLRPHAFRISNHLILLNSITQMIFSEENKSWGSVVYTLVHRS